MVITRRARTAFALTVIFALIGRFTTAASEEIASKYIRKSGSADTVIVFVHGVLGDAQSTWTAKNGAYWPALLAKDPTFDAADIYVFSYSTGFWATLSIDELAENMRADFAANGVTLYKKIIFLSHSMGGLVTRAYLLKHKDIAAHTWFAYFFSTPTTGSQIASFIQYISSSPQISKLKSMNADDYIADLLRQWLAAGFTFPSYCAYEKRLTKGIAIVSMASAAALCTKALDPIDTDHIDIVKPENNNSMSYMAFKSAYADAKIPELNTLLHAASYRLRSEIEELVRFPNGTHAPAPRTMLELMLVDQLPQRIFEILSHYNKSEIVGVPSDGETLYQYKQDYYEYQSIVAKWETDMKAKIGQKVAVRFDAGWQIYLRYIILRISGRTKEELAAGNDFLNFGISWDDAERVFIELLNDPAVKLQISELVSSELKVAAEAKRIASSI